MGASRASPVKATYALFPRDGALCRVCLLAILLLLCASARVTGAEFLRVGYINASVSQPWKNYPQLFNLTYTHIITTFGVPDASGAIDWVDASDSFVIQRIHEAQAAGSKVLVSIGGSTVSYKVYVDIAADPDAKANFISNALAFVTNNDYDGVDANFEGWWYPDVGTITALQRDNVDQLILDLAQAVKAARPGALFTVTLAPLYFLPVSPSAGVVNSDLVDMAHHMGYDFMDNATQPNGPFRAPGTAQWLYWSEGPVERSVRGAFSYLYANGYDLFKITGGVPFYVTDYASWDSVRADADWPSVGLHVSYLEKQHPVDGRWVNDAEAIDAKIAEYREIGLAGVMVWQVGEESPTGDLSQALYAAATRTEPWSFPRMVNFQPPLAECPDPYTRDNGTAYGTRGDYGWR
ncbi:MAG: glycoside hydrolase family 18 protein [Chlamydiota bacterium]